nr:hypothetical protein [Candidatus Comchoanobacter bicostacola]
MEYVNGAKESSAQLLFDEPVAFGGVCLGLYEYARGSNANQS